MAGVGECVVAVGDGGVFCVVEWPDIPRGYIDVREEGEFQGNWEVVVLQGVSWGATKRGLIYR